MIRLVPTFAFYSVKRCWEDNSRAFVSFGLALLLSFVTRAQTPSTDSVESVPMKSTNSSSELLRCTVSEDGAPNDSETPDGLADIGRHWLKRWLRSTDEARASQPHFTAPIVTTHVMLVQQFRYDISSQNGVNPGLGSTNYGSSRGSEFIPTTRLEIGLSAVDVTHQSGVADGFGDFSFQVKYRRLSGTEGKGDYFVGLFLGASLPTGSSVVTVGHTILLPP